MGAACLRFIHLTSLSLWPLTDEAKSAYYAMELAVHGKWSVLYDFSQLPPLYIWLLGAFFKIFGISLFSLWFFPALLSLLTAVVSYPAAKAHFPKTFAFFFSILMAFSFWPLYVGRFSHQGSLLLLWELLVFWMAGQLAKAKPGRGGKRYGLLLGLLAGGGFYTFTSWPAVAFVLILWVLIFHRKATGSFLSGMILVYLPLGIVWLRQGYGGYIHHIWDIHPSQAWGAQILRGFWDFSAFFWKSPVPPNLFAYKPFWGGYLNPLLGACFFLGTILFIRQASWKKQVFVFISFFLLYLPGFLTGGVEMYRVLPILPLLLLGSSLGLMALLAPLKCSFKLAALTLLLLASFGMDFYHLFGVYHGTWTRSQDQWFGSKSMERIRAYQILEDLQGSAGPGLILSELVPDLYDQTLTIADYGFNAEQNPRLDFSRAHWAAFLANIHYQPYLAKNFPEAKWFWLASDMGQPDGGMILEIIPLPCSHPKSLDRLVKANEAMEALVPMVYDYRDYLSRQPILEKMYSCHPLFQGDRFLESCFWEKIAENQYGDRNYEGQIAALRKALERGCPAAHLYNDLGTLYLRRSRFEEAREAFQKALSCNPNHTSAAAGLKILGEVEKTGQLPRD